MVFTDIVDINAKQYTSVLIPLLIYQDSKRLVPVLCCTNCLIGLWPIWAEQDSISAQTSQQGVEYLTMTKEYTVTKILVMLGVR